MHIRTWEHRPGDLSSTETKCALVRRTSATERPNHRVGDLSRQRGWVYIADGPSDFVSPMGFRFSFSPKLIQVAQICVMSAGLLCLFFGYRGLAMVALVMTCAVASRGRKRGSGWRRLNAMQRASVSGIQRPNNIAYPIREYRPGQWTDI